MSDFPQFGKAVYWTLASAMILLAGLMLLVGVALR